MRSFRELIGRGAQFQEALLHGAQLRGVPHQHDHYDTFAECMRALVGRRSDLSDATFKGGLSQKDIDSIVEDLSAEMAKSLREKLRPHIDRPPSFGLPINSVAITGAYNKEEAEKWIAEYEKAISEVPTDKE